MNPIDITKIPRLERVEYNLCSVKLFYEGDRHGRGIYLSGIAHENERIQYLQQRILENTAKLSDGWPTSSQAQYAIERDRKDLDLSMYIYLPVEFQVMQEKIMDKEVTYLTDEERKGNDNIVAGPSSSIDALKLKPGDRFIDNHSAIKYILQEGSFQFTEYERFHRIDWNAIEEKTQLEKKVRDHECFQKLEGKGIVFPSKADMGLIIESCKLDFWTHRDYLRRTVYRYMRSNKITVCTPDDITKIINIIKSL